MSGYAEWRGSIRRGFEGLMSKSGNREASRKEMAPRICADQANFCPTDSVLVGWIFFALLSFLLFLAIFYLALGLPPGAVISFHATCVPILQG